MSGSIGSRRKDFAMVPTAAVLDPGLSHAELRALATVAALRTFKTGWATCGTQALAAAMGLVDSSSGASRFRDLIKKSIDLGYVESRVYAATAKSQAMTIYRVIYDAPAPSAALVEEDQPPLDEDLGSGTHHMNFTPHPPTTPFPDRKERHIKSKSYNHIDSMGYKPTDLPPSHNDKNQSLFSEKDSEVRFAHKRASRALDERFASLLSETQTEDSALVSVKRKPQEPSPKIAAAPLPRSKKQEPAARVGSAPEPRPGAQEPPAVLETKDSTGLVTKGIAIPDWIPVAPWHDYVELREAKKRQAPFTPGAVKRTIADLQKIRAGGDDPGEVLGQSVQRGWTGVFPLRKDSANLRSAEKPGKLDWTDRYRQQLGDSGVVVEGNLA